MIVINADGEQEYKPSRQSPNAYDKALILEQQQNRCFYCENVFG